MFEALSRSWEITKQTFSVINKDKEMLVYPIIASVLSIILFLIFLWPMLSASFFALDSELLGQGMIFIVFLAYYICASFISAFSNVAVAYIAKERFEGKNANLGSSFKFALTQVKEIFMWSLLNAIVGMILRTLENAARKQRGIAKVLLSFAVGLLGAAWSIATLFVVQVIVFKDLSVFAAIKDSVSTVKKTWGESLVRYFGLGAMQAILNFAGIIVTIIIIFLSLSVGGNIFTIWFIISVIIACVIYLTVVNLVFSVANTVFNTALYIYATTGKVPSVYSEQTMKNAFKKDGAKI